MEFPNTRSGIKTYLSLQLKIKHDMAKHIYLKLNQDMHAANSIKKLTLQNTNLFDVVEPT